MENNQSAVQQRLIVMMNEIHKICIDNGIKYTMIGGTLIGALRHKGFIPWDDDIDIAMPYVDYKRFTQIVLNLEHEWMEFGVVGVTENYYSPYIKVFDKRTTLIEKEGDFPKGIFIDIFPIVFSGNYIATSRVQFIEHRFWQSLLKRKGYHFSTGKFRECILRGLSRYFSTTYIIKRINDHYDRLNKNPKKYISDMDGNVKGIVRASLFSEYTFYSFEGYMLMGIKYADEYLHSVFGNYMQLPPISKQKPNHIVYINLELSYKEYNTKYSE